MDRVKRMNPHACEYHRRIEPCQWSRSHFSKWPKSDNITNNNVEVFNSCIKKMRKKSIITMPEEIRCYIMRILARNKKALVGYMGRITPVPQSRLEVEKRYSNHWRPFPMGDLAGNIFEIQCLSIKVSVDLGKKICSCRFWQLNGLPCRHACAALAYQNRRPEEYANNWLTVGAYNKRYEFLVQLVPSKEFWEKHGYTNILPPAYKRSGRRPTVKRNKMNDAPEPQPDPHRVK
ncbi:hypothetical protein Ahy_B09g095927 [Arachis hypogaea]|uniref:SWIM-type domain-containing protein n=1 Tax=Arachis hypogaea TaxID=3818 RepID=A0A444XH52_ARAHY|nr:hypothetical protein Ahy_B09g095927 [Arachis hypogaea]